MQIKQYRTFLLSWALAAGALAAGCGGSSGEPETTTTTTRTSGHERTEEPDDGVAITGLMGTISQEAVRRALDPRMDSFGRCFFERIDDVPVLAGDITLSFRIRTDGTVLWVYPSASTVGDRDTEACILGVAQHTRFSPPRGGEAEFTWGFGIDAADDVRPPVPWSAERVADAVSAGRGTLSACPHATGFRVTAYVGTGGVVLGAGATASSPEDADALECVTAAVRDWTFPDPGSYPAKVTFDL